MMWLSLALGSALGLLYQAASYVMHRHAVRHDGSRFMVLFLSGLLVRMGVALGLVTLVLVVVPVQAAVFVLSFLVVFMTGLVREVAQLNRHGAEQGKPG